MGGKMVNTHLNQGGHSGSYNQHLPDYFHEAPGGMERALNNARSKCED